MCWCSTSRTSEAETPALSAISATQSIATAAFARADGAYPQSPERRPRADFDFADGASARNWAGYGDSVVLDPERFGEVERALLTDPQTSGGLLIACAPESAAEVLAALHADGFGQAAAIGAFAAGKPVVRVA